jgi:hypothetical protein
VTPNHYTEHSDRRTVRCAGWRAQQWHGLLADFDRERDGRVRHNVGVDPGDAEQRLARCHLQRLADDFPCRV